MTMTVPAVGAPAPEFALHSTNGELVTLAQFKGKSNVLLAFFPLAGVVLLSPLVAEERRRAGREDAASRGTKS